MKSPCKDCIYRHVGCHSHCNEYMQFKAEREYISKKREVEQLKTCVDIDAMRRIGRSKSTDKVFRSHKK